MKTLFSLLGLFCAIAVNAQNYLISFSGTGASANVSTVKVENLNTGTALTLNGTDILRLTGTTAIDPVENGLSSQLVVYPNPSNGNAIVQVSPPSAGDARINVFNPAGVMVAQSQYYLDNDIQEFHLSGIGKGFYLVQVTGNNYQYSGKVLSNGNQDGKVTIEKTSTIMKSGGKTANISLKKSLATIDMPFATGDRLKFTGISGNYSTVVSDIPTGDKTITFIFIACADADLNNYPVVYIGTQTWMAENLKTSKYQNGDLIGTTNPTTLDYSSETTPKYRWVYDDNANNFAVYGRLYTWYAVSDNRNVCPAGWHVPTNDEWNILANYLEGERWAGGNIKEKGTAHWNSPNTEATNKAGFTALPGGFHYIDGSSRSIGSSAYFWTSTELSLEMALFKETSTVSGYLTTWQGSKKPGYSVRCIKNN